MHCVNRGLRAPRRGRLPAEQRRLAYDTLPAFQALQARLHAGGGGVPAADLRAYAAAISDLLAPEPGAASPEPALWDLLAVLFLHAPAAGGVATEALAWALARHEGALGGPPALGPAAEALALSDAPVPEAQPGFWEAAARLAALGRVDEAGELLGRHTLWRRAVEAAGDAGVLAAVSALEAALGALRGMPRLRPPGAPGGGGGCGYGEPGEFHAARAAWRGRLAGLRGDERLWAAAAAGDAALPAGAARLLGVLAGNGAALAAAASGWLELLAARLLHQAPGAPLLGDGAALAAECVAAAGGPGLPGGAPAAAAGLLAAAAERDAAGALAACSAVAGPGSWLLAHAVDLLPLDSAPRLPPAAGTPDLAEWYRVEYAGALAAGRPTAAAAAEVAAWCPRRGRPLAAALAAALPPGDAAAAARLARRFGLAAAGRAAGRCAAAAARQAGHAGEALRLYLAADEPAAGAAALAGLGDGAAADVGALLAAAGGAAPLAAPAARLRLRAALAALAAGPPPGERATALEAARAAVLALAAAVPAAELPGVLFGVCGLLDAAPPLFGAAEVQRLMHAVARAGGGGLEAQAVQLALVRALTRAHVAALCPG